MSWKNLVQFLFNRQCEIVIAPDASIKFDFGSERPVNEPTDGSPDGNNEGMGPKPSSHTSSGQTPRPDKPTVDTTEHEATTSNTTTYRKQSRELESVKFVCICHC